MDFTFRQEQILKIVFGDYARYTDAELAKLLNERELPLTKKRVGIPEGSDFQTGVPVSLRGADAGDSSCNINNIK